MPAVVRPAAGTRPAEPVRQAEPPSDYLCTWVIVQAVWSIPESEPQQRYWELKFINALCPEHGIVKAA